MRSFWNMVLPTAKFGSNTLNLRLLLGDFDCALAILELAVNQPVMDMPELLSYIDDGAI